jgi:hypothetical protein
MAADPTLSVLATERRAAALPGLLAIVRARGRRRAAARVAGAALLVALLATLPVLAAMRWWPRSPASAPAAASAPVPAPASAPGGSAANAVVATSTRQFGVVGDDPTVLARCRVDSAPRPGWQLDDDGLHRLLLAAGRPAGVIRVGDRVRIDPRAIDRPRP